MSDFLIDEELLAAIDMGSNSFHLAIARVDLGGLRIINISGASRNYQTIHILFFYLAD